MSYRALAQTLKADSDRDAARYDAVVLHNTCVGNVLEVIIGICAVLLGGGGVVSIFNSLAALDGETDVGALVLMCIQVLVGTIMGVLLAYVRVMDPRGKVAAYGAASDTCGSISAVANHVVVAELGVDDADRLRSLENLVASMLISLEASSSDNLPPLKCKKKEA